KLIYTKDVVASETNQNYLIFLITQMWDCHDPFDRRAFLAFAAAPLPQLVEVNSIRCLDTMRSGSSECFNVRLREGPCLSIEVLASSPSTVISVNHSNEISPLQREIVRFDSFEVEDRLDDIVVAFLKGTL
ncbi:hypothetical protein PMAYCL1PPCAC_29691, partial [Pristionchus mayeri]